MSQRSRFPCLSPILAAGISESNPNGTTKSGAIYKFVPDRRGDLTSGQLYALKVLDASRTGEAIWVPLDRALSQVNSDIAAINAGATGWGRPEDIEINTAIGNVPGGAQVMFVASTSEALVLRIELRGRTGRYLGGPPQRPSRAGRQRGRSFRQPLRLQRRADRPLLRQESGKVAWVHVQHAGGALQNDLLVTRP
jgi:hypothetical protein